MDGKRVKKFVGKDEGVLVWIYERLIEPGAFAGWMDRIYRLVQVGYLHTMSLESLSICLYFGSQYQSPGKVHLHRATAFVCHAMLDSLPRDRLIRC